MEDLNDRKVRIDIEYVKNNEPFYKMVIANCTWTIGYMLVHAIEKDDRIYSVACERMHPYFMDKSTMIINVRLKEHDISVIRNVLERAHLHLMECLGRVEKSCA